MPDPTIQGTVDARDMVCTRPLLEVRRALGPLKSGDILEILCDDNICGSIERVFTRVQHNEIISFEEVDGHRRILLRKV